MAWAARYPLPAVICDWPFEFRGTAVEGTDFGDGTSRPFGLTTPQFMAAFYGSKNWTFNGNTMRDRPVASGLPLRSRSFIKQPPDWFGGYEDEFANTVEVFHTSFLLRQNGLWWPAVIVNFHGGITVSAFGGPHTATVKFFGVPSVIYFFDPDHVSDCSVGPGDPLDL